MTLPHRMMFGNRNFPYSPGNKGGVHNGTSGALTISPAYRPPTVQKHPPSYRPSSSASCMLRPDRPDSVLDADSSSTKSGRRPSIDTVSTYLSQESKDSELRASRVRKEKNA